MFENICVKLLPVQRLFLIFILSLLITVPAVFFAGNRSEFIAFFNLILCITTFILIVPVSKMVMLNMRIYMIPIFILSFLLLDYFTNEVMYSGNSYLPDSEIIDFIINSGNYNPMGSIWHLCYWFSIFLLTIITNIAAKHKGFRDGFIKFFLSVSVLIAVYGLFIYMTGNKTILWFDKDSYYKDLTATFINRNSYATFAGCGFLVGLYHVHRDYVKFIKNYVGGHKIWLAGVIDYISSIRIFYVLCSFLIFIALILTNSRAGIALSIAFSCVFFLLIYTQENFSKKITFFILGAVVIFFVAPLILQNFLDRALHLDKASALRTNVYDIMLAMIQDYSWRGVGLGGFEYVFQSYRDTSININGYWDKGHNTLLEIILEIGIPLSVLLFFIYAYAFYVITKTYIKYKDSFLALCLTVCGLCITHSMVDFSLQMPAINILFHIMMVFGYNKARQYIT